MRLGVPGNSVSVGLAAAEPPALLGRRVLGLWVNECFLHSLKRSA